MPESEEAARAVVGGWYAGTFGFVSRFGFKSLLATGPHVGRHAGVIRDKLTDGRTDKISEAAPVGPKAFGRQSLKGFIGTNMLML